MTRIFILILLTVCLSAGAQKKSKSKEPEKALLEETSLGGLSFRNIGPAITSGRISDFAVNPANPNEYYVAASAGGVWKTTNSGTTYKPIFDGQGSFSIGCVEIDPQNSSIVWVGTGENNNQRSVNYGDGVYKSMDGGKSWKNMGLKNSEHIGSIVIDPTNSNHVYVAAIGPLWSAGGERGVYESTDGGETWNLILEVDKHTGANEVVMDPRNPQVLYASMLQRRRHVFTYIGGGPGSGIYKSQDGGKTWNKANKGLPGVDMGRIGLSISPADPEIIYAIVEAAQGKGGFFKSTDRGASWEKQSGYSSSGNYYQEIIADPVDPNKIYTMDTWMHISTDGGKSFKVLGEDFKHIDNHCIWIDPAQTDHLLVGCDGGVYETFDAAATWIFKANLPVTQFYKVAVDQAEPFYNIYGGTQDNFSMGGPSRTTSANGIANSQWFMTHGGDGFESQIDPENPNIVYAQSQYGFLVRYDRLSGEEVGIQPKERKDEDAYRWNWDAPLVISKHDNKRIYFSANKVFRSDDRGNSWQVISDDLTQQIDRNTLRVMDRVWGIDAVMKNGSTSPYGTIVAMDESPIDENLLYVGTDDGLIQVTEDGGKTWTKSSSFPGVPANTYVNMVIPSQHDINVVYACFNNHKRGDFKPYVFKSSDKGKTWVNITGNLPERGSAYAIAEDHVKSDLLFAGTEFGIFFSINGGKVWNQLKAGIPTTLVRDIAIQQRENDLVLASFGRGFFILDDYSALRELSDETLKKEAHLFEIRDALLFEPSVPLGLPKQGFQGDDYYLGDNLPSVAMFTYYLKDEVKTKKDLRQETESANKKDGKNNVYPTYEALTAERNENDPYLLFTITDSDGNIVRKLTSSPKKGVNRLQWDLRYAPKTAINFSKPSFYNPFASAEAGSLIAPGKYAVSLSLYQNGEFKKLTEAVEFNVKVLNNSSTPAADRAALVAFQAKAQKLDAAVQATQKTIGEVKNQLKYIKEAVLRSNVAQDDLDADISTIEEKLYQIELKLNGDRVAGQLDLNTPPPVSSRIGYVIYEAFHSTSSPTQTHLDVYEIAKEEFTPLLGQVRKIVMEDIKALQEKLGNAGAPYTPYTLPDFDGE